MPLIETFAFWVASMLVGELLRPKLKVDNAKPAGQSDFQFPTATEDRTRPYVFGTVKLDSPNVTWWGDLACRPIKKKAGKGGFLGTGSTIWQTVGYRYYAGMKLSLCMGPVELLELQAEGKTFWSGTSAGGLIPIAAEALFGGEDGGGGLAGTINFLPGSSTHAVDTYLQSVLGTPLPAWRGVATLVWRGPKDGGENGYLGTSTRIAPISAVVRRLPSNLGQLATVTNLAGDANAAEVIYEVLTSSECGMSQPAALVDIPSFQLAAQQLAAEGFGISGVWERGDARSFIDDVLRTIDACCFLDFASGKWRLTLARGGYDVATLPVLDQTSISALEGYSESALDESTNQVQVSYTSRVANFSSKQVQAQAFANIRYQDAVVNQSQSYPMISTAATAAKVADRDLRAISTSLAKGDLICNRKGRTLKPGDVFILKWAPLGLDQVICRVLRTTRGDLHSGAVRISFVKDVFALGTALYAAPAASGWVNPSTDPVPCSAQALMEAPYWVVGEAREVLAMGARADQVTLGADIWTDAGAGYLQTGALASMSPTGLLTAAYSAKTAALDLVGFTINGGSDLALLPGLSTNADGRNRGQNLAWFPATGEIISWTTATDNLNGTYTIAGNLRGVLDSVPTDQALGDRVWFISAGAAVVQTPQGGSGAPGTPGTPGRGYTWRGAWVSTTTYAVDDTVSRLGSAYVSIQAGTNQDPATATAYWSLMAQKGADGTGAAAGLLQRRVVYAPGGTTSGTVAATSPVNTETPGTGITITQGLSIGILTVTPKTIGSTLVVRAHGAGILNAGWAANQVGIFKDGGVANVVVGLEIEQNSGWPLHPRATYEMITTSLTPISFEARAGSQAPGTFTLMPTAFLEVEELI